MFSVPTVQSIHIRTAVSADAAALTSIYNHYILNSVITFEEAVIATSEMSRRIEDITQAGLPWLVAQRAGEIIGYAYAGPWRSRSAFRFTVESTVYMASGIVGTGTGTALYQALLAQLDADGKHCVVGAISLPNAGSVKLHERLGFRKVAHFEQVGYKFDRWIDVGFWQRLGV